MIRCELTACAVITRSASVKAGKDDTQFVSFGITVPVVGRNGEKKNLEVGVTVDGGKDVAAVYTNGRRVNILGILNIVKRNGKVFFNLRADGGVELTKSTDPDKFEGKMEFKGKIGRKTRKTMSSSPSQLSLPTVMVTRQNLRGFVSSISIPRKVKTSCRPMPISRQRESCS